MNPPTTPESLLAQLAQIQRMDRGSVSLLRHGPSGPYYNHQCYENGRNVSRYVPAEQVPELQAALADYHRFQQLVRQYVDLLVELDAPVGLFEFVALKRRLAEILGARVDLVTRKGLKPQLREGIEAEAVRAA